MPMNRYGRLTVTGEIGANWQVRCDCGIEKIVRRKEVLRRDKGLRSCGCLQREAVAKTGRERNRTHGMKNTATWRTWSSMKSRCLNPNNGAYGRYGGAGITVCDRWLTFENFFADMGERPSGTTIGRRDKNGPYDATNCRWATKRTQARNRGSNVTMQVDGRDYCIASAAERYNIPVATLKYRIGVGWDHDRACKTPVDATKRPLRLRSSKEPRLPLS